MGEVTSIKPKRKEPDNTLNGFGRGALVALRSRGTLMVVESIVKGTDGHSMLRCAWNMEGMPGSEDYYPEMLVRVDSLSPDEPVVEEEEGTAH